MSEKQARDTYKFSAERFGGHVRFYRIQARMTQEQLARRSLLHPSTVGKLENGRREPELVTIFLLAGVLGVPPGALLR